MRAWKAVLETFVLTGILMAAQPAPASDLEAQALKLLLKGGAKLAAKKFSKNNEELPPPGPMTPVRPVRVQTKEYVTRTPDGWSLVIRRYWVDGIRSIARPPIVLCHGFGYSSEFFDLKPEVSLAEYLAQSGFDVWVPDLRGSGKSSKWALSKPGGGTAVIGRLADKLTQAEIPRYGFVSLDPKYYQWTMDDHIDRDIPAILNLVKQQTGARRVAWVGHSMGGTIMLAYLAKFDDTSVSKLITVGAQVTMPESQLLINYLVELISLKSRQIAGEDLSYDEILTSMNRIFFNEWNTAPEIMDSLIHEAHDTPSVGLIQQYVDLCRSGRLRDARKQFDYSSKIGRIQCPCLIMSGGADQIAPVETQRDIYQRIGSRDKTLLTLNRRSGLSVDSGHNDSLVGFKSRAEVYPLIARWLLGEPIGVVKRP